MCQKSLRKDERAKTKAEFLFSTSQITDDEYEVRRCQAMNSFDPWL